MRCVLFVWVFLTLEKALGSFRAVWPGMPSSFQRGFFRELEPPVDVVSAILSCDSDGFEDPPRVHLPPRRRGVPGLACFSSASAASLPSASLLEELTLGGVIPGARLGRSLLDLLALHPRRFVPASRISLLGLRS